MELTQGTILWTHEAQEILKKFSKPVPFPHPALKDGDLAMVTASTTPSAMATAGHGSHGSHTGPLGVFQSIIPSSSSGVPSNSLSSPLLLTPTAEGFRQISSPQDPVTTAPSKAPVPEPLAAIVLPTPLPPGTSQSGGSPSRGMFGTVSAIATDFLTNLMGTTSPVPARPMNTLPAASTTGFSSHGRNADPLGVSSSDSPSTEKPPHATVLTPQPQGTSPHGQGGTTPGRQSPSTSSPGPKPPRPSDTRDEMEESDSESNSQSGPVSSKPSPKTPKKPSVKTPAKVHTSTAATTGFGPHGSSDPSGVSSSDKATPKRTPSKPILTPSTQGKTLPQGSPGQRQRAPSAPQLGTGTPSLKRKAAEITSSPPPTPSSDVPVWPFNTPRTPEAITAIEDLLSRLQFFELTCQADLVATLQEASSIYNALGALLIPGKQPNASNLATALCKHSPPEELGSFLRKLIK